MDKRLLIVLGVFAVAVVLAGYGKITGNAFAYNLPRSCTDSDGGNDPYVPGSVEYKSLTSVKSTSFPDRCTKGGLLLEHYCGGRDGLAHRSETITCDCEDGACKK